MKVIGPSEWPSTLALEEALKDLPSEKVLHYGTGHRMDGLQQLEAFKSAGLLCPTFTTSVEEAQGWIAEGQEVWGRQRIHTHGRDIVPVGLRKRWRNSAFWVQRIPSSREFRQHIFNGRAIRLGEKVHAEASWRKLLVRSRSNGWHIQYPPANPVPESLRELAKAAVASVGYLFGAVDILLGENGLLYVLEVNSAPSLADEATLKAYVGAVEKWIKRKKV